MKNLKTELIVLMFLLFCSSYAQEPKPPEAITDYAEALLNGSISVNVLTNDFAEDGHPLEISYCSGSSYAGVTFEDSLLFYQPETSPWWNSFPFLDTVTYKVKDLVNQLISEPGFVIVTVHFPEFDGVRDSIEINNYQAAFSSYGNYFKDYFGDYRSRCIVPKGSETFTMDDSRLVLAGKINNHIAMASSNDAYALGFISDFRPGPLSGVYSYSLEDDEYWDRTWKINRDQINHHIQFYDDPGYSMPASIASWPGNGDVSKGQTPLLARFTDRNGNGIYEPEFGDAPWMKGDVAIFSLFNDQRMLHLATSARQLGVEVHQTAYAWDCPEDSVLNNTLFINYLIINKGGRIMEDFYVGILTEFSIGTRKDDYFGCDTLLQAYFAYNDSIDEPYYYTPNFGSSPPAQGVCFLNMPLFAFVRHDMLDYIRTFNTLTGLWPYGVPVFYGGNGTSGTDTTTFLFTGDPWDPEQWSEIQSDPENKGMKWGIGSAGPYNFYPGDSLELDIAYVFARDYCGTNLSSVALLKERIAQLRWYYENDSTPCGDVWSRISSKINPDSEIQIFPNPVEDLLWVRYPSNVPHFKDISYSIVNVCGLKVAEGNFMPESRLDLRNLAPGMYLIVFKTGDLVSVHKFVKN